jgi:hypothetical protein
LCEAIDYKEYKGIAIEDFDECCHLEKAATDVMGAYEKLVGEPLFK